MKYSYFETQTGRNKRTRKFGKALHQKMNYRDFPGGAVVKNLLANAGNTGSSPGPGGSHMPQSK